MESHEPGHPDTSDVPVLTENTRIRDTASGDVRSMEAWIHAAMEHEGRDRTACTEAMINAIARGDYVVAG